MIFGSVFRKIMTNYAAFFTGLGWNSVGLKLTDLVLKTDPANVEVWYDKGKLYKDMENFEKSLECFNRVLELDSNHSRTWHLKANLLEEMGKKEESEKCSLEAIKCYDKDLEPDPSDAITCYNKGVVLQNLGEYEDALPNFNKSLELNPEYAHAWEKKAY